jgi:hypothetical protein
MKKTLFTLFLFSLCQISFCAEINSYNMNKIDQRLKNILIESRTLPSPTRERIESEVKSIWKILGDGMRDDQDNHSDRDIFNRGDRTNHDNRHIHEKPGYRLYNESEFSELKTRLKAAWPYRDQIQFIKRVNKTSAFTIRQILDLTKVLDFPNDQKEVALILLPKAFDPENVDVLYELFWTISDKEKINAIVDERLGHGE